jgi:predicted Zn-ribbon and HTH transcriptional regulator
MPVETSPTQEAKCLGCGFTAPAGSDEWNRPSHPPLGTITQCPECGSTDVHTQ